VLLLLLLLLVWLLVVVFLFVIERGVIMERFVVLFVVEAILDVPPVGVVTAAGGLPIRCD